MVKWCPVFKKLPPVGKIVAFYCNRELFMGYMVRKDIFSERMAIYRGTKLDVNNTHEGANFYLDSMKLAGKDITPEMLIEKDPSIHPNNVILTVGSQLALFWRETEDIWNEITIEQENDITPEQRLRFEEGQRVFQEICGFNREIWQSKKIINKYDYFLIPRMDKNKD